MSLPPPYFYDDDPEDFEDRPPPPSYCTVCYTRGGHTQGCPETPEPEDDDSYPPRCTNPEGHVWNRSAGEADEARLSGDYENDNIRCIYCGADGDA